MTIRFFRYGLFILGFCLLTLAVKGDAAETPLYTIVEPRLTCEQAIRLSTRTIERLGFTLKTSVPTAERGAILTAERAATGEENDLTVTILCDREGARVEAVPDVSPCERANQRATTAIEQLGFTITSTSPVRMGSQGFVQGARKGRQGQETVTATIQCRAEAVFMDAPADSPLFSSPEFLKPIEDVRRGFFALFKPMADALTNTQ